MRQHIPRAVIVITVLHAVAALAFGVLAHVDSSNQFPDLVVNDNADFAVGLYANRNIGVGVMLVTALVLGIRWGLVALFGARFVTDVGDFVMGLTQADGGGAVAGQLVFFALLFASEIYVIRRLILLELTTEESRAHI